LILCLRQTVRASQKQYDLYMVTIVAMGVGIGGQTGRAEKGIEGSVVLALHSESMQIYLSGKRKNSPSSLSFTKDKASARA
jgi:hypothetical protein